MSLLKLMGAPLLAFPLTFSLPSSVYSYETRQKEMSVSDILDFVKMIREKIPPFRVVGGENEGKKGIYYSWDFDGDGNYNLILFNEFMPGTVVERGDLIFGRTKPFPHTILLNLEDPEKYNTNNGDILLKRNPDTEEYERTEYVESERKA